MQMAKTSCAVAKLNDEKILYINILTDPTYGGVTASFGTIGDIIIAEQGARIGFAGRRNRADNQAETPLLISKLQNTL